MSTLVLVPATILILMGSPVSRPCAGEVVGWRVVQEQPLLGTTVTPALTLTYSVDGKELVVHQEKQGRVFCDGFELNTNQQRESVK